MSHELAVALQQAGRIRQRCALKEPYVDVRVEYIDIAERRISQTGNRTAVMQKLPDFVPAISHRLKPLMRDGSQFTGMLSHPCIDGGIPLDSAVESQQFRRLHGFQFIIGGLVLVLDRVSNLLLRLHAHWTPAHARAEPGFGQKVGEGWPTIHPESAKHLND